MAENKASSTVIPPTELNSSQPETEWMEGDMDFYLFTSVFVPL